MDLDRLRQLLDAYGADPERWPAAERTAAIACVARSREARDARDAAACLDRLLDLAPGPAPSRGLADRVLAAAPSASRRPTGRRVLAVVVPLAAAASLALWLVRPAPRRGDELTPEAIIRLGDYTASTDVLLAPPGLDLADTAVSFGCTQGDLGCIDLAPAAERDSKLGRIEKRRLA